MKFNSFDQKMRQYEVSNDRMILPGVHMVVRLDGQGFTKFCKRRHVAKPFDEGFRDIMLNSMRFMMESDGFRIKYGYCESDEISLLLDVNDSTFNRKERKILTTMAGELSGVATHLFGEPVSFDARICELTSRDVVIDYFRWRQQDSERNALNGYAYYTLIANGFTPRQASRELLNKGVAFKNELLFSYGINFNDVPAWQKRGMAIYPQTVNKEGFNPVTKEKVLTTRNVLVSDLELPYGEEYSKFLENKV